jgi:hypothetical protein
MQKVVGSNPISRFSLKPRSDGAFLWLGASTTRPLDFRRCYPISGGIHSEVDLDVAYPSSNLFVLRVTSCVPKRACGLVVECNQSRDPSYTPIAKVSLGGAGQP